MSLRANAALTGRWYTCGVLREEGERRGTMKTKAVETCGLALALATLVGCGPAAANDGKDTTANASSAIVTNENGGISRTFMESSVTTNGSLVTEHRRETRTDTDMDGNILQTTTSEYAQSYSVGDTGRGFPSSSASASSGSSSIIDPPVATDSFLGLKFGDVQANVTNAVRETGDSALLRVGFKPKKALSGFDDYYVYVTPKTHRIAKICACAKEAVEPSGRWRRHYLIEALEKRYRTWARLCSWRRPCYAFDIAPGRAITLCLAAASDDYETVIAAWDDDTLRLADEEQEQIRAEARKTAAEQRGRKVNDAADAF